jgi:enoyl-CoA hydratase/carnithine racemase
VASDGVRAIVVTGAARGFCAGADMRDRQTLGNDGGRSPELAAAQRRPQSLPLTTPKPIVAAINGACAGIGLRAGSDVRPSLRRRPSQVDHCVRAARARG